MDELSREECLEALTSAEVGRIAWCTPRGPVVVPVNIAVHDGRVWIRTTADSEMVARVDAERVAVQVDHVDVVRRAGWSVLAHGVAAVHFDPAGPDSPVPWPPGPRPAEVVVTIGEVSGRRLSPGDGGTKSLG
ncbi:pyridoxamine 5'-phosphate oxidase family protein [Nocardioides mangrovi]|uniref:Pyridoxamine 5'-phosphate oxidase family protein n=1 Tax=Nocardioides mangrovi TaxID=2874580 RepID=A0ABS7U7X8_9ACTN|nr:pyridoxamine 5'-phosphate oxidase family protein [Nocardioides mangrovi]MBZ5736957.1 pyridoxamine 5'-phosphate oxidase family protein [Nocardioides mangrovi]